jgi:hypothetical protein
MAPEDGLGQGRRSGDDAPHRRGWLQGSEHVPLWSVRLGLLAVVGGWIAVIASAFL